MNNKEIVIKKDMYSVAVWENVEEIRKVFAPTLTETEFIFFVELGKYLQANPFMREIWAVKYQKDKPASIFLGRDFYRRKAQEQEDYEGHIVEALYENDHIEFENGILKKHIPNLKNPGKLVGAYCVVYKKGKMPFCVRIRFSEYNKGQSSWRQMPETMIKKVAECQGLRGAYQGIFKGTYGEGEEWFDKSKPIDVIEIKEALQTKPETKKQRMREKRQKMELEQGKKELQQEKSEPTPVPESEKSEIYTLEDLKNLAREKGYNTPAKLKLVGMQNGINFVRLKDLTQEQISSLIKILETVGDVERDKKLRQAERFDPRKFPV